MATNWYLVVDSAGDGAWNMAKDEVCLKTALRLGRPILRLYRWREMTLSLGRNQKPERRIDLAACARLNVGLVRRSTGGQAVLHGSDLTYSVASPLQGTGFEGGIMVIYREISRALVHFFEALGLEPEVKAYTGRQRVELASPVCFATPSAFEIMVGGRKVVGSAQRLLPDAFLQHGSVPLEPQTDLLSRIFLGAGGVDLQSAMTNLAELGLGGMPLEALQDQIVRSFLAVFGAKGEPLPWSTEDDRAVEELAASYRFDQPTKQPGAGELTSAAR